MGRTACTEPQCLYKGDLYLYLYWFFTATMVTRTRLNVIYIARLVQFYV